MSFIFICVLWVGVLDLVRIVYVLLTRSLLFAENVLHPLENVLAAILDISVLIVENLCRTCTCKHAIHLIVTLLQRVLRFPPGQFSFLFIRLQRRDRPSAQLHARLQLWVWKRRIGLHDAGVAGQKRI